MVFLALRLRFPRSVECVPTTSIAPKQGNHGKDVFPEHNDELLCGGNDVMIV